MEFVTTIIHFLTDTKRKISSKLLMFCSIIFLLVIFDNYIGFSFYYSNEKKVAQTKEINELIESVKDSTTKTKLYLLEQTVLERRSLKDKILSWIYSVNFSMGKVYGRSSFWNMISATWSFWITGIAMFFIFLFDRNQTLGRRVLITSVSLTFCFLWALIFLWITTKIPTISGRPWINYVLNSVLQIAYSGLTMLIIDPSILLTKKEDKSKETLDKQVRETYPQYFADQNG